MSGCIQFVTRSQTRRASTLLVVRVCAHAYLFLFYCVCLCEYSLGLRFSSGGEWQRTGVIGSSLSPQTGLFIIEGSASIFLSRASLQTQTTKFFSSQTLGGKMQVSSYLIILLNALRRKNKLPCARDMVEEKRVGTTKQCCLDHMHGTQSCRTGLASKVTAEGEGESHS